MMLCSSALGVVAKNITFKKFVLLAKIVLSIEFPSNRELDECNYICDQ